MSNNGQAMHPYPKALAEHPTVRQSKLSEFDRCALMAKFAMEEGRQWAPNLIVKHALERLEGEGKISDDARAALIEDLPKWGLAPVERGWSTHEQAAGLIGHLAIGRCLEQMYEQDEERIPVGVAEAILEDALRQHDIPLEDVVAIPAEQIAELRWSIRKWAGDTRWTIQNLVSIEEQLETTLHYPSDYGPVARTVTGRLDALFAEGDRGIVPDWKFTWMLPPETEVSFTGYFQQRMYGLLVLRKYTSLNSVTLMEWYVRRSEPRTVTIRREALPEVEAEMSALVERFDRAVQHESFKPSPGKHCSFCTFPERCPIERNARGDGAIENEEQARQAAAEMMVADEVKKRRWNGLRAWSDRHGWTPVSDAKGRRRGYGYKETVQTAKPSQEELEVELRRAQVDGRRVNFKRLYKRKKGTKFTRDGRALPDAHARGPEPGRAAAQVGRRGRGQEGRSERSGSVLRRGNSLRRTTPLARGKGLQRAPGARKGPKPRGRVLKCATCGESFYAGPSKLARGQRFCSRRCAEPAVRAPRPRARKRKTVRCLTCGEQFEVRASMAPGRKFCSRQCFYQRADQQSPEAKERVRALMEQRTGEANPNYKHGRRVGRHRRSRSRRFKSGQKVCQAPGCKKRAQVNHHVIYEQHVIKAHGDPDDPHDALGLCNDCHTSHHRRGRVLPVSVLRPENIAFGFDLLGPAAYDYFRRYYRDDAPHVLEEALEGALA